MSSAAFKKVMEATGYVDQDGRSAAGLTRTGEPASARVRSALHDQRVGLHADAVFEAQGTPTCLFKDAGSSQPTDEEINHWHEAAWNIGVAPLLWIITPTDVRLYDCYAATDTPGTSNRYILESVDQLRELNATCGRLATETGAFWSSPVGRRINRRHRVDRELLAEISALEERLVALGSNDTRPQAHARDLAQRFIGRCIFAWYLLDRGLAQPFLPKSLPADLSAMFSSRSSAFKLFEWLRDTFNGDLFPMDDPGAEQEHLTLAHLGLLREFVEGRSLIPDRLGQGRLFRFRFSAIPVDLISSIYQQFARSSAAGEASAQGLHYTPVELVHLTLDPVFEELSPQATVVDPACGSGAFLVEAFRRLVWRASGGKPAARRLVRKVLYQQLFGIDINRSALGIAAFSLYLAALELDDEPVTDIIDLRFDRLIGQTLFEADSIAGALPSKLLKKTFDVVVGNPPWTFVGHRPTPKRNSEDRTSLRPRRSPDQAFLSLAADLAGKRGRIGMIMKATPFFSKDKHAVAARAALLDRLTPAALINLSYLRREDLFPDALGPALLFFSRCALAMDPLRLVVGTVPWTADFRRTGVFQVGPGEIRSVPLEQVLSTAPFLKAATFGTVRDGWLIERLEKGFPTLGQVLDLLGRTETEHRGQGFQVQGDENVPPPMYRRLKVVTPEDFTAFRIDGEALSNFKHKTLHRPRRSGIFRGPLLICSKVGNDSGAQRGRYSAAVHMDDVLFTQNFYGVSFRDSDARYAYALSAILNSSLTAFQFAFGGPTWGLERPTVEPHDLLSLRIPAMTEIPTALFESLLAAEHAAAATPDDNKALSILDEAVFDLYDLEKEERVLASESVERARYMIFENRAERSFLTVRPHLDALRAYADQVTSTVNAYLRVRGERHLRAFVYRQKFVNSDWAIGVPGITAVRFVMAPGSYKGQSAVDEGNASEMDALTTTLHNSFDRDIPPYLNERRQLRLYGEHDLLILKPSEVRYWTRTAGLNDADIILADHWTRRRDATFKT